MRRAVWALAVVAALPLASCSGGGGDEDRYRLTLDGRAEVAGGADLGAGRHQLAVGDVVRITEGTATLGLPGRRLLELRAGTDPADDSRVEVAATPTLIDGHALLLAGEDETARLRSGAATISLREGAARVRRSTGVHLAVYEGRAGVRALGRERAVRAYRQMAVPDTGALPRRVAPIAYDRDDLDPWDRRFLGAAVDLGSQLDRTSLALNRRLAPPSAPDPDYYRQLVPGLRARSDFGPDLLEGRRASVGETVVGAAIVLGGPGSFAERWDLAFDFREDGADWGLVALDQQAQRGELFGVLDGILDAVAAAVPGFRFSPVASGGGGTSATLPEGPSGPTDPGGDDPVGPEAPLPGTPTIPALPTLPLPLLPDDTEPTPPPTVPEPQLPEPVGSLLDPVTEPVVETVGGVVETVGGLLGGLTGPLLP